MIIDDILARFETVIESKNDAKTGNALRVREGRALPDDPGRAWQGCAFVDVPELPAQGVAFGDPGKAEYLMTVEVVLGWEARGRHRTELDKALHTEARVRHALETDTGWPSGANAPTWQGGSIEQPAPGQPEIWAIVGRYQVVYLDTFPETT